MSGCMLWYLENVRICYLNGQLHRAIRVLRSRELERRDLRARLLASQCLFDTGEFEECLNVLNDGDQVSEIGSQVQDVTGTVNEDGVTIDEETDDDPEIYAEIQASLCVLRGRANEELEHVEKAVMWYRRALEWDVHCYEAFDRLSASGLMTDTDKKLIIDINSRDEETTATMRPVTRSQRKNTNRKPRLTPQTTPDHLSKTLIWLRKFYSAAFDAFAIDGTDYAGAKDFHELITDGNGMEENVDVLFLQALRCYRELDFQGCLKHTKQIIEHEPNCNERVTILHLGALVELDERLELFKTGHALVENAPRSGVSWMAVGYYYFTCRNYEAARKHFQKATALDVRLLPAWIALGHAFAAQDESDQAMAAYRTASRMFVGARLPRFYMAVEYTRQSTFAHARVLFLKSLQLTPKDPAPYHELGVIAYKCGEYQQAADYFIKSLALWQGNDEHDDNNIVKVSGGGRRSEVEEATLFNLGHCYRKLTQFELAIDCYEKCLLYKPQCPSTCSALGLALHSSGDFERAVEMYHRALRFSQEDTLTMTLLDIALEDMIGSE